LELTEEAVAPLKPSSGFVEEDRAASEKSAAAARVTIANWDTGCTALRTAVGLIDELEPEADHQFVIHNWRALRGELVAVPRRHSSMVLLPSPSAAVNSGASQERVGRDPRDLDEADRASALSSRTRRSPNRLDRPSSRRTPPRTGPGWRLSGRPSTS
jgi:hypothetical protein